MATEEGVVIRIDSSGTWVKTRRTGACESCSSRGACHTLGGGREEMEVSVLNPIGARPGDGVLLRMETSSLLKASFLIYLFPILMLMLGAGAGEWIARAFRIESPLPAAIMGFGALGAGLFIMKSVGSRLGTKSQYRPRIVRIVTRASG
jgi:sigma-E factor negative regulatory protein RseC